MSILVNQDAVLSGGSGEGTVVSDFKTINGESIVGSGDIVVGGGNSIEAMQAKCLLTVDLEPYFNEFISNKTVSSPSTLVLNYTYTFLLSFSVTKSIRINTMGFEYNSTTLTTSPYDFAIFESDAQILPKGLPIETFSIETWGGITTAPVDVTLEKGKVYWLLIHPASNTGLSLKTDNTTYSNKTMSAQSSFYTETVSQEIDLTQFFSSSTRTPLIYVKGDIV